MSVYSQLENLLPAVQHNDMGALISLFQNSSVDFDSPLSGRICNNVIAQSFVKKASNWLTECQSNKFLNQIIADNRVCTEYVVYQKFHDRDVDIPISIVCDMKSGKVTTMRIYHACEYIVGHKVYRQAILNPTIPNPGNGRHSVLSESHRRYFKALREKDITVLGELFAKNGSLRGSAKCDFYYEGENLMNGFKKFFETGGIPLQIASVSNSGIYMFIEFVMEGWGGKYFYPQCGSAVYTHDSDGKILSVKIYDDMVY